MLIWFFGLPHTAQALLATLFPWAVTAAGAGLVFCFRHPGRTVMDAMLGFAAGVMVAASFWSLLDPCLELAEALGACPWLTALAGIACGGLLLTVGDKLFARGEDRLEHDGRRRCRLLFFSITLHNIPEGLAVGVAFGSLAYGLEGATPAAACLLALGIGLQNFPEGAAVSVPLRREGVSCRRAFLFGQASALVEPMAGTAGALLAMRVRPLLPGLLAFAAGAMLYVVVQELIPESQQAGRREGVALFTLVGFAVMMVLDVVLG